jgi:hypothetical protein
MSIISAGWTRLSVIVYENPLVVRKIRVGKVKLDYQCDELE